VGVAVVLRSLLRSKIHGARVTGAEVEYVGSIAIDSDLAERVDLAPGERVHVWDVENGQRFETYVIEAERLSGTICVNGAAAHRVSVGDRLIIAAFALADEPITPRIIVVDSSNHFAEEIKAR
jgi:aspartate 1-decarboxylase